MGLGTLRCGHDRRVSGPTDIYSDLDIGALRASVADRAALPGLSSLTVGLLVLGSLAVLA